MPSFHFIRAHYSFESIDSIISYCTVLLASFTMITSEELINIVSVMNKTTCSSDPSHLLTIIDTITHMINLCIYTRTSCKSAIVLPLIKKSGLDP